MLQRLSGNAVDLASKLIGSSAQLDDEKDLEEESYETQEVSVVSATVKKTQTSQVSFDTDSKEELETQETEEAEVLEPEPEMIDMSLTNEAEMVNSPEFAQQMMEAIQHVTSIAKDHRQEMIASAKKQLAATGDLVTDEMVSKAMRTFAVLAADSEVEEESDEEKVDEALLAQEMEEALEAVRFLAKEHQPEFVDRICEIYSELNDEEPSTVELHELFSGIQEQFAEEATEIVSEVEDEEELDAETLAEEMELALVQVRKQAQLDQEELVDFIWDYYLDFNGSNPSVEAISDIFSRIKSQLAEEEREEFLSRNEQLEEEDDADYSVDGDSETEQYAADDVMDLELMSTDSATESEFEAESDSETLEEALEYLEQYVDDEEGLVNNSVFAELWCSAIDHIESVARADGVEMVLQIVEGYQEETGKSVSSEMIEEAVIAASTLSEEEVDSELTESEDEEDVAIDLMEAVEAAKALGAAHKEEMVHRICDQFVEENGEEPSLNELYSIFGLIQECFAEEEVQDEADCGETDAVSFAEEWASAMEHVQSLAREDQEGLVDLVCDIYADHHGSEPSTPELYEIFAGIKASFADEATEDLVEAEVAALELDGDESESEESDDEDYSPEEDSFDYQMDALDDVLYHDSASDEQDASDSDYLAEKDALELTYVVDAEDDVAESSESEVNEDDEKASELGSDSEWSPDKSAFDYLSDYEAEHFYSSSPSSSSESESASSVFDADYNPGYDVQDYSSDYSEFVDSDEDDEDYSVEKDEFDYSQDLEEDYSEQSGSEESACGSSANEDVEQETDSVQAV